MKTFIIATIAITVFINFPSRFIGISKNQYPRFLIKNRGHEIWTLIFEIGIVVWGLIVVL